MSVFRFKQFEVSNERSAMKVNTDGVLLGALSTLDADISSVLDIGTGTGTVALMIAQRLFQLRQAFDYQIDAIDIDLASAEEARMNFSKSAWSVCMSCHHLSLSQLAEMQARADSKDSLNKEPLQRYDLLISNPPFFVETLHSPDNRKAAARHADSLSWSEIVDYAAEHLTEAPYARLVMILPSEQELPLRRYAAPKELYLSKAIEIRSSEKKAFTRTIIELSRKRLPESNILRESLSIHSGNNYSEEYLRAVRDFLLFA